MSDNMTLNIIFPVLNEHLRLERGITKSVDYLRQLADKPQSPVNAGSYRLIIADNGSDDDTPEIGKRLEQKYDEVTYLRIEERGVGIAFKTGVEYSTADIVGYMDIDLSTDIRYLEKTLEMFARRPDIEYVNASRFHRKSVTIGRKWYRKITSAGLLILLKVMFGMKSTDAICGFTFMRYDVASRLIKQCSDEKGWFYMIELLLRAERSGVKVYDLPIRWVEDYDTTVNVKKTIRNYIINIVRLKRTFITERIRKVNA